MCGEIIPYSENSNMVAFVHYIAITVPTVTNKIMKTKPPTLRCIPILVVDVGWPAIDAVIDGLLVPVVVTEAAVPLSLLSDFVTEVSLSLAVAIAVPEVDVEPTFPLELESYRRCAAHSNSTLLESIPAHLKLLNPPFSPRYEPVIIEHFTRSGIVVCHLVELSCAAIIAVEVISVCKGCISTIRSIPMS